MTESSRTFGQNLRGLRKAAGVTQEELARRLEIKRQGQISLWERNASVPRAETITRIAAALRVGTWELLEGVELEYDRLRRPPAREQDTDNADLLHIERRLLRETTSGAAPGEQGREKARSRKVR